MARVGSICLALLALSTSLSQAQVEPPNLAGLNYTYRLLDGNNEFCFHASFKLNFKIIYTSIVNDSINIKDTNVHLPATGVQVGGDCGDEVTTLQLRWTSDEADSDYSALMTFNVTKKWTLSKLSFNFTIDNSTFEMPEDEGPHSYTTTQNETNLFNRTFSSKDYFFCKNCKVLLFTECANTSDEDVCIDPCFIYPDQKNATHCASVEMTQAVIYPGDFNNTRPKKKLCIEDYIAQQEIIVPVVVGGVLTVLLLVIFFSYVIAYGVRRRKEAREHQYEPLGGADK